MKYRFLEALNDFLSAYGRDDLINSQLDCHSTIQLILNRVRQLTLIWRPTILLSGATSLITIRPMLRR